jgi:hypothetical protein
MALAAVSPVGCGATAAPSGTDTGDKAIAAGVEEAVTSSATLVRIEAVAIVSGAAVEDGAVDVGDVQGETFVQAQSQKAVGCVRSVTSGYSARPNTWGCGAADPGGEQCSGIRKCLLRHAHGRRRCVPRPCRPLRLRASPPRHHRAGAAKPAARDISLAHVSGGWGAYILWTQYPCPVATDGHLDVLNGYILTEYTGSLGTRSPPEVQDYLEELRRLCEGS